MKAMTDSDPVISVIIPTFNRANYLAEAAASILGQTYRNFELLIVDDCSSDQTAEVVLGLASSDDRVRLLRTEANSGCNVARNVALDVARGLYVAFLDDDDLALPDRLDRSVRALEENGQAAFIRCGYGFIDAERGELPGRAAELDISSEGENADRLFEILYCDWAWLPTSALMFRSSVFCLHRYPDVRRSDGDSQFLGQVAATGNSCVLIEDIGTLVRRDRRYTHMSEDWEKVLAARRETLTFLRAWLKEEGITRFDHLHRRARANHLVREARHKGGWTGLARVLSAAATDPGNRSAGRYLRELSGRALRHRAP